MSSYLRPHNSKRHLLLFGRPGIRCRVSAGLGHLLPRPTLTTPSASSLKILIPPPLLFKNKSSSAMEKDSQPLFELPASATLFVLIFLASYPDEPRSSILTVHVFGNVTDKTNSSPVADVEILLMSLDHKISRITETDENGQYSLTYKGKCNCGDRGTT